MTDRPHIALLVITDGRRWCLQRTLASFEHHVDTSLIGTRVIVNDAAEEPSYQYFVDDLCADFDIRIPPGPVRRGFGGAIAAGWNAIWAAATPDYVFHLEDDFDFLRDVDLGEMVKVLDENPELVQLCLRRQPWNEAETAAGGVVEQRPTAYTDRTDGSNFWLEHRLFFSTNPSLYRGSLLTRGWPQADQSEGRFSISLFAEDPEVRVGYWGRRSDDPWVRHIGANRVGTGY
jgi:hypothetical protein